MLPVWRQDGNSSNIPQLLDWTTVHWCNTHMLTHSALWSGMILSHIVAHVKPQGQIRATLDPGWYSEHNSALIKWFIMMSWTHVWCKIWTTSTGHLIITTLSDRKRYLGCTYIKFLDMIKARSSNKKSKINLNFCLLFYWHRCFNSRWSVWKFY